MAKISTYPLADTPLLLSDRLIGTEAIRNPSTPTPLATKNFSLGELLQLFSSSITINTDLQQVLDGGNTATQNINLTGTIDATLIKPDNIEDTSGSQGTTFQFLSKGTSSINWVDLPVNTLQTVLNAGNTATQNIILVGNITTTKIIPGNIQDDTSGIGTAGQILSKTASGIRWINTPTSATPGLADVLSVGNTATNNITLVGNINVTNARVTGAIYDSSNSPGTAGQILSSTVTGTDWIDSSSTITPSALTKVNDTNVTLTLGGTPATALLEGVSLTLGWTGTLADSRIASASIWNAKQAALSGTGLVKSVSGTISYIADNSTNWDTAYTNRIISLTTTGTGAATLISNVLNIPTPTSSAFTSLTTTGSSGSSTLIGGVLNVPTYTLVGLGGQPQLNGTGFVKVSGTTVSYDNSTYYLASNPNGFITSAALTGYVQNTRTLTINGTAYDLSADRSWSVGTVTSVSATSPITSSGGTTPTISTSMATNKLIGRSTAGTGVMEEIAIGTGLTLSAGTLSNANSGTVTSVGLTMPAAFTVSNSPITGAGTIAVTGAGTASQYIRGDGALATYNPGGGGGGASVSYYLNGSVSQGTIGGVAYKEMNSVPVIGAGTDFTINANGYIAQFITDAGDPNKLLIPAGNWNFETYFSASSNGGSPRFYIELYKYDGTTFTLIATNSATPENITGGTSIDLYFTALAVPTTTLLVTDRLAVRFYVINSGRTITMHTENSHLSQIITTFSTGLTALNGLTAQVQNFATGTSGSDFNISSITDTHTFNLPTASASNRGALSSTDWSTFNGKQNAITLTVTGTSGAATLVGSTLNIPQYAVGIGGSGTTNKVPKFTSASTIGDSLIFDNGTNIGIDNTSPSAKLDVNGSIRGYGAGNAGRITSTDTSVGGSSITLNPQFSLGVPGIESIGAFPIAFNTNSSEKMRLTSAGDLGIGINTPSQKLHVSGNARVTGAIYDSSNSAGTSGQVLSSTVTGTAWTTAGGGGTVTSVAALTLGTTGTDLSSTVANGTTTPVITLNVPTASASNRGALSSSDWSAFNGKFTLPSLTSGSVLFSNGTTIAQDNANFFWDDTNNRLGIGTASPDQKLAVEGNIRAGGVGNGFLLDTTGVNFTNGMKTVNNYETVVFSGRGSAGYVIAGDNDVRFGFGTTYTAGEKMRITSAGSVGIGISTPAKLLDVNGDALINGVTVGRGGGNINSNTAIGKDALSANTAGSFNTVLGLSSGITLTGSNNIFIGANAGSSATTANLSTVIGGFFDTTLNSFNQSETLSVLKEDAGLNNYTGEISGLPHIWAPETKLIANSSTGTLISLEPLLYSAIFIEYNLEDTNGSARAGSIKAVWNSAASTIKVTEETTADIGSTGGCTIQFTLGGGLLNVELVNTNGYNVYCNTTSRILIRPTIQTL